MARYLKIVEPGFTGFNGYIGTIEFTNSVSEEITPDMEIEALRIASVMRMDDLDGCDASAASADNLARISASSPMNRTAPVVPPAPIELMDPATTPTLSIMGGSISEEGVVETGDASAAPARSYTRADLEAIADAEGLAGLREVGERLGVKAKSIPALIDAILFRLGVEAPQTGV